MRASLVIVVAACGNVNTSSLVDAGAADSQVGAAPDATSSCPTEIVIHVSPSWLTQGPFEPAVDPAGSGVKVWATNSHVPNDVAFTVPFVAGDRIIRLVLDAYGSGGSGGLQYLKVVYYPRSGANVQITGMSEDLGRNAQWGHVVFPGFEPTVLSSGSLVVRADATEPGYYLGQVTAAFERPCSEVSYRGVPGRRELGRRSPSASP